MDSNINNAEPMHTELASQEENNTRLRRPSKGFDFLPVIAFAYLTYNTIIAIYRSRGNPWDLAFVILCFVELTLLFLCLKKHESLGADAPAKYKHRLKIVVWLLTTLLTIMPLCLKMVVWGMSASLIVAGFYAFFILDNNEKDRKIYGQLNPEEMV